MEFEKDAANWPAGVRAMAWLVPPNEGAGLVVWMPFGIGWLEKFLGGVPGLIGVRSGLRAWLGGLPSVTLEPSIWG